MARKQAYIICVENARLTPYEFIDEIMNIHKKQSVEKYALRVLEKGCERHIRMALKCKKQYGCKRIEKALQRRGLDAKFTDLDLVWGYHLCFEQMEQTPEGFQEVSYMTSPDHPARSDSVIRTNEIAAFHRWEELENRRHRKRVSRNRKQRVKEHRKLMKSNLLWGTMWSSTPDLDEHFFNQFPDCIY